ncbi:DUF3558 domain-containing protein [Amycolatopsis sp. NPDC051903]|uniref:DUF3558 domain-containing protein n=1 Tax=Amycolatopsis sp. NPDC051903 TaxID=3363936 RepID=UPI0037A41D4D
MRTAPTSALVAALALGVAGCSSADPGTAYPVETAVSSASQAAKASQLPPRPADLSLTGVDPCELLGQAQLDELQVNSVPRKVADPQDGPTCVFDADKAEPFHAYHLRTVNADLQEWLTGTRRKNSMTTAPFAVESYPALTNYRAAGTPSDCEVLVGVAKGQTLAAQAFAVTQGSDSQQQLCDLAGRTADLAVQYLKTRS